MSRKTFTRGRRLAIALNVLISSALALTVGGLLIYLAFRPEVRQRVDLTPAADFTLSDESAGVLSALEIDVDIYTCFRPHDFNRAGAPVIGLSRVMATIGRYTNDLIKEYELQADGRVEVHLYDPEVIGHIPRIDELRQKLGEQAQNVVVVECGEGVDQRRRILRLPELAEYDEGASHTENYRRPQLHGFTAEQALTSAILEVTDPDPVRVGFVYGHGERDPAAIRTDRAGQGGYSSIARSLQARNVELSKVDLTVSDLTPDDLDVLVVAAPTVEIPELEVDRIARFVEAGGDALILVDRDTPIGLDYPILDQLYGLKRRRGSVKITASNAMFERRPWRFHEVVYSPSHPSTQVHRAKELRTQWNGAVALETLNQGSDLAQTPLVWTDAQSQAWVDIPDAASGLENDTFDPSSEQREQARIAFAIERRGDGPPSRAVVIGDADLFDDMEVDTAPGNRALFLNAVSWISDREDRITMPLRDYREQRVDLAADEYQDIQLYIVLIIPGVAAVIAVLVFWMRRS